MKDFIKLVIPYFYGSEKRYARWAGLWLLVLSQASTAYAYLFIQWNRRFYHAIEIKSASDFYHECAVFISIVMFYVLTYSFTKYCGQKYALRWRMWMTNSALAAWLVNSKRSELEGSDQRIQEDLMRFTTIFERIFLDCFNALLLILLFTPLLFIETTGLSLWGIPVGWVLLISSISYTALGMLVCAKIANPLIDIEYENQKLEAALRYELVHVRDGATRKTSFFSTLLAGITGNYTQMYNCQKNYNLWQKFYDQVSYLLPFLLLSYSFFNNLLSFAILMQVRSTFSRIRNSMAYLLDHYTELTEMLAIAKRLTEFYTAAKIDRSYTEIKELQPKHAD